MTHTDNKKTAPGAALVLFILVFAAVSAPLCLNKVSPIAPYLMDSFQLGAAKLGLLISVFSITGIFLALPSGLLIQRFGPYLCILAALFALLLGSLLGIFAPSFLWLLISRILEGTGLALIAVAGPAIVNQIAPNMKKGLFMGIFSSYVGIGQVLTYNLAPLIAKISGWKNVWWACIGYILFVAVLWILLMTRMRTFHSVNPAVSKEKFMMKELLENVRSKSLWLLTASLFLYTITYAVIQMFLPTYLNEIRGMELSSASSLVSICCLAGTVSSLLAGIISDKLNSRRLFGGLALIVSAALFYIITILPLGAYPVFIVILGMIPPILPVCAYAAYGEIIKNPSQSGTALGILTTGQNLGFTLGPVLFGFVVQQFNYHAAFYYTMPLTVLGGILLILNKKVK
ncbi:MFS transporter [Anaerocolumna xylanovorans]|uniref:Nitrate/nitrite transporter NarK n=1 Tax=Anaerocolumna xylanovorans DSM 12503 TaxID=1121345 RepID=A0A1M7XZ28_9FIRM|nr:MFS transporter [Anaerocolumna xylanovorans]SHO44416.1 Nitrate/nitrite transporter NarK [Anaerocolumna xylanovorans DSM 12503]